MIRSAASYLNWCILVNGGNLLVSFSLHTQYTSTSAEFFRRFWGKPGRQANKKSPPPIRQMSRGQGSRKHHEIASAQTREKPHAGHSQYVRTAQGLALQRRSGRRPRRPRPPH